MKKEICFDMDGTIADLYGVEGWLEDLEHFSPRPYEMARQSSLGLIFIFTLFSLTKS